MQCIKKDQNSRYLGDVTAIWYTFFEICKNKGEYNLLCVESVNVISMILIVHNEGVS